MRIYMTSFPDDALIEGNILSFYVEVAEPSMGYV
jgi:hypothetical protein